MFSKLRITVCVVLAIALLSACSKMPDHARYIPKDAVAVAGVNVKALSKKIAWNMITGSKLFKEMQKRMPEKSAKDAMNGIEKAGIDAINTFYVYVKTDARFKSGNRITGLVPLSDAAQWETYVKQILPGVKIQQHGDRKEASLGTDMYVGWNKNLLIIINVMEQNSLDEAPSVDADAAPAAKQGIDDAAMSAEMESAFAVSKDNSIIGNKRYIALEEEGHDVLFWLNYEQLMTQYGGDVSEKMGGLSLSNNLWNGAAFTSGFDFVKGKITGDIKYFMPEQMKEIGVQLGAKNADKDMMERLPSQNMDMLLAMHIAPQGIKATLEKMGLLGLANEGLMLQDMSVDKVLDAFTGDMAFIMNDFSLKSETVIDTFLGQAVPHQNQKPSLTMSYVVKINKKDNFQKMVQLAKDNGLKSLGNGFVIPLGEKDSVYIMMNDQFAVASNKYANVTGFLDGTYKAQKMSGPVASTVMGHPWAFYLDIQQMFKNIDNRSVSESAHDSAMIAESKKLLSSISFTGGEFKESALSYHLDVSFMNTDENSIINLMDYGMRMSDADKLKDE
jgi:hypothetical protein